MVVLSENPCKSNVDDFRHAAAISFIYASAVQGWGARWLRSLYAVETMSSSAPDQVWAYAARGLVDWLSLQAFLVVMYHNGGCFKGILVLEVIVNKGVVNVWDDPV